MRAAIQRATVVFIAVVAVAALYAALPAPARSSGDAYLIILQEECIDCGVCADAWPDIYMQDEYTCKARFNSSTTCGYVSNSCVLVNPCEDAYEAVECCPVNAIVPWIEYPCE